LLRQPLEAARWQALVEELTTGGLVGGKPLRLTDAGRSRALGFLGLEDPPQRADWRTPRDGYLMPHALGVPTDAGETRRIGKADGLRARILKKYDLPTGSAQTLNAALEALACKRLGFPGETALEGVRDAVLGRLLDAQARLGKGELIRQLPQAAASRRADPASLREALRRDGIDPAQAGGAPGASSPAGPEPFDPDAFAATVRAPVRDCREGRFGDNKVFIHRAWDALRDGPGWPVRSPDEFKRCRPRPTARGCRP
jgi:hypothetical protein